MNSLTPLPHKLRARPDLPYCEGHGGARRGASEDETQLWPRSVRSEIGPTYEVFAVIPIVFTDIQTYIMRAVGLPGGCDKCRIVWAPYFLPHFWTMIDEKGRDSSMWLSAFKKPLNPEPGCGHIPARKVGDAREV
ncbi:hypothetical protein [Duncaniella dubosii]|uniref:hypothetical protein n=1 Tax=Duncaniella dubosii TaxID=2518971 RepID=UPI003F66E262